MREKIKEAIIDELEERKQCYPVDELESYCSYNGGIDETTEGIELGRWSDNELNEKVVGQMLDTLENVNGSLTDCFQFLPEKWADLEEKAQGGDLHAIKVYNRACGYVVSILHELRGDVPRERHVSYSWQNEARCEAVFQPMQSAFNAVFENFGRAFERNKF